LQAARPRLLLGCGSAHSFVGGKRSYFGVFDRIFARAFPAIPAEAVLGMELMGPPDERCQFTIAYEDSEGHKVMPEFVPDRLMFSPFGSPTFQVKFQGLPIPKPGISSFRVRHADLVIGERVFYVEKLKQG